MSLPSDYLLFRLGGATYGLPAPSVRELAPLPRLSPVAEAPPFVAGALSYRGHAIAVLDLARRLGLPPQRYGLDDHVLIFQAGGAIAGLLAHQVLAVHPVGEREALPAGWEALGSSVRCGAGLARYEDDVVTLLNPESLVSLAGEAALDASPPAGDGGPEVDDGIFALPEDERVERLLAARSASLTAPPAEEDFSERRPFVVIGLGEERFALPADAVEGFIEVRHVTPIPCCPEHVVGAVNLRGEVLTLIDIRGALQVPVTGMPRRDARSVMVTQSGELRVGVLVDEVLDVLYLQPELLSPAPAGCGAALRFLEGMMPFGTQLVGVLDFHKLLHQGGLMVNEHA
ncbi:MAG: chemotaxis protein CheW [Armatimonadota bacterium]